MPVCLFRCRYIYLSLFARLCFFLSVCLSVCLPVCFPAFMSAVCPFACVSVFIHSFIPAISIAPLQVLSTTQRRSRLQHGYCIGVSRRSAQAFLGKGLAQGPYVTARAGVEPTTLRLKVIDSTKAPSCPNCLYTLGCLSLTD